MRRVTDPTIEIIWRLENLMRLKPPIDEAQWQAEIRTLLDRLGALGDLRGLSIAAKLAVSAGSEVAALARQAISVTASRLSSAEIQQVAESFHAWMQPWWDWSAWGKLRPADVDRLAGAPRSPDRVAMLGLLSFHENGYVRQAALRQLSEITNGSELPYLLLRQNDWVDVIAAEAQSAVANRINDAWCPHLLKWLPLVLRLDKVSRRPLGSIVRDVISVLLNDKYADLLRRVINESDLQIGREVIRHGLSLPGSHRMRVIDWAVKSSDPINRLQACRKVMLTEVPANVPQWLNQLLHDPYADVRREALSTRARLLPDCTVENWREALVDTNRSIRELARYWIALEGSVNIPQHYREILARSSESLPAVAGLGESCEPTDLSFFKQMLSHRFANRRCIAIRAVTRLSGSGSVRDILLLLKDDSPRVLREARQSLRDYLNLVPADELADIALHADAAVARRSALSLLATLDKWQSISGLLKVASQADAETAACAAEKIQDWLTPPRCNRNFTKPSAAEREAIQSLLSRSRPSIWPGLVDLLNAELSTYA